MTPQWGRRRPGPVARLLLALSRHTPLGRGRARRALMAGFGRLHSGPADTRLWGAPVRLFPDDNHAERKALMNPGRYDRAERDFLVAGLRGDGAVYVDIGANAGLYAIDALTRAPGVRVLAIEPQPALVARLRDNVELLGALDRVTLVPIAVGEGDGVLNMAAHANASVRALNEAGDGDAVRVRPLIDILTETGVTAIAALKIDIEGWEDRALAPFLDAAPDSLLPRRVAIEHALAQHWRRDCIALMLGRGYAVVRRTNANTLLERAGAGG